MSYVYLLALLVSLFGVATLDRKYQLALIRLPKVALITLGIPYLLLIIWDCVGIVAGIFYKGDSPVLSNFNLAPNFPVEELLFLALLCYTSLVLVAAFGRRK